MMYLKKELTCTWNNFWNITYLWLHFVTSLLLMSLWLAEKCLRQTTCCLSSLIDRSTLQIYHKDQMSISMLLKGYFHLMQFQSRYQIMLMGQINVSEILSDYIETYFHIPYHLISYELICRQLWASGVLAV